MKFTRSALGFALASSTLAAPTLLPAESSQPACSYPIGQSGGSNAKVAGRLFEIDGKVEYFAGGVDLAIFNYATDIYQVAMLGGLHI